MQTCLKEIKKTSLQDSSTTSYHQIALHMKNMKFYSTFELSAKHDIKNKTKKDVLR